MAGHGSPQFWAVDPRGIARAQPIGRTRLRCHGLAWLVLVALSAFSTTTFGQIPNSPAPDTAIQVSAFPEGAGRQQLILEPGEPLPLNVTLALPDDVAGRLVGFRAELRPLPNGKVAWSFDDDELRVPVSGPLQQELTVPMPAIEGVYEISISVTPPRAFQPWKNLGGRSDAIAKYSRQVVVLGARPPASPSTPTPWQQLGLIEPTNPRWWQRLPSWTQVHWIPGMSRRGLTSSAPQVVQRESGTMIELPPSQQGGRPHWQAYALPVDVLGRPHKVEIEYPTGSELQLGLSVIEPDTSGGSPSQNRETRVFIDKHAAGQSGGIARHELTFWPRSSSPVLLITNHHPTSPGFFGRIRISAGPKNLTSPLDAKPFPRETPQQETLRQKSPQRLLASYLAGEGAPAAFGVAQAGEESANWQSSYDFSGRLADCVRHSGYNAAIVSLDGTKLFSTEPAAEGTADGFELLLRIFDRQQLTLIPAVKISDCPPDGLERFLERYADHPSLGGLMVKLTMPDSYAQHTAGVDPVGWRTAETTETCRQLAALVRHANSQGRLIVTTDLLLAHPLVRAQLRPAILQRHELAAMLKELGVNIQQLEQIPGLTLLKPRIVSPQVPLVDHAVDLEINASAEGQPAHGILVYHRPTVKQLSSLPSGTPLARDGSELLLVSHPLAGGAAARKPFIRAMLAGEPDVIVDGRRGLASSKSPELATLMRTLQWLPPSETAVASNSEPPLLVRTYRHAGSTVFCVLNDSPWTLRAQLTLQTPDRAKVEICPECDSGSSTIRTLVAGSHAWPLELAPYGVSAFRLDVPGAEVTGLQFEAPEAARQELEARIASLTQRELNSSQSTEISALENPSFEPFGSESAEQPIAGWEMLNPSGTAQAGYERIDSSSDRNCVFLQTSGRPAGLQSNSFAIPATGQLALTASIRAQEIGPDAQLHIVFESEGEPTYRQTTILGAGAPSPLPISDDFQNAYTFSVDDLPLDSRGQMHVRFELHGAGKVWIDDLTTHNVLFSLPHLPQSVDQRLILFKTIRAARSALENDDLANCQKLLDGYWLRFVEEYLPIAAPAIAEQSPREAPPAEEKTVPSVTERLRDFWRFR